MAEDPNINFEDEFFTFTVMDNFGEEIELIKNGKNLKVSNKNRKDYARLVAKYYLAKEVSLELKEFLKGFWQVVPRSLVKIFDSDELDFLMGGAPVINLDDWSRYTEYKGQFNPVHRVILWFWEVLKSLN
jgi:hypothetical protein